MDNSSFENLPNEDLLSQPDHPSEPQKAKFKGVLGCALTIIGLVPVLAFVCIGIYMFLFFGADTYDKTAEYENFSVAYEYFIGYHKMLGQNHASVIEYRFDGEDASRKITIPDSYDGIPIGALGGYLGKGAPAPFCIEYCQASPLDELEKEAETLCGDSYAGVMESGMTFDEVFYDDFELYLGKQVKDIRYQGSDWVVTAELQDGRTVAYCMRIYVVCDEENKNFYSQDGVLYKKDGTVFDGMIYVGQELNTRG